MLVLQVSHESNELLNVHNDVPLSCSCSQYEIKVCVY